MTSSLTLRRMDKEALANFVSFQIRQIVPDGLDIDLELISSCLPQALERSRVCINAVRLWRENEFDYLHSSQYCTFLYYLANTIWQEKGDIDLPTKLFILNKTLNSIDLFYEVKLPDRFFIGHSIGIVLAKADYADYFAIYQNSTVGKNHGVAPVFKRGVVMYPNTAVIGRCKIGAETVIAQGVRLLNESTPGKCIAFRGADQTLVLKAPRRSSLADIFRLP